MLLEFEKLGVATIKDLRDIKKSMTRKIPEPIYEKEIKIKKKEVEKKKEEEEEENIYDGSMNLDYINSALKKLKKFKSEGKYDTKIKIYYNLGYNNINDEELKKLNKKIGGSSGQYEETFYLTKDDNINEVIEILNILKKNIKILNMFSYNIEKHIKKKSGIIGLATIKDLRDIKKSMNRQIPEPIYEKEIKIKKKEVEKKEEEEENISILDCLLHSINKALKELKKIKSNGNYEYSFFMEYNIPYINNGDEDLKKTIKKENSKGDYGNYFNLNNDNEFNEAISTLNILKKNNKLLRTFKYKIKDYKNKKSILGLGIKKNKKNNNSYLSLLKSMI